MFFFSTPPGAEPSIEHIYVDRGDPAVYDKVKEDLTIDSGWHSLDLSAIVPAGAVLIHCRVRLYCAGSYYMVKWRKNGNSNTGNIVITIAHAIDEDFDREFWVACDSGRVIEYLAQTGSWNNIDFVVRGWIVPGA